MEGKETKWNIKTFAYVGLFIALVLISLVMLYYIYFTDEGETFLYTLVVNWFINPIYLLGFLGILLFIGIMAIQGLLVPIPSEIVLLAAGMIWGSIFGGFMGIIGSMAAGLLCYYISKKGGRPLAEKFVGEKALYLADNFIEKYGWGTIIIARSLPFLAFDPISYAAGLVELDIKKYSIGTLIGSIPRSFFYSVMGTSLMGGLTPPIDLIDMPLEAVEAAASSFNFILLIILGILVIMFVAYYIASLYSAKKAGIGEKKAVQKPSSKNKDDK